MKTDWLKDYVSERLKSVEQDLKSYEVANTSRHLHHLRVEIKKIKAVFSFVEKLNEEKYYQNELKSLFDDTGGIRELQIHIRQLDTLPGLPEKLTVHLVKKKKYREELFRKNISRYINRVCSFREKIYLPAKIPGKKSIINYFRKEVNKSKQEIDSQNAENMHRFRMRLKKIMYVYDVLPEKIQSSIELNTDYINKLQKK